LVLWLNQVTRWFSGEPPQTPRTDSGRELLPCTGSSRRLRLAFLTTMRPTFDPAGHRVPRVRPTCLFTPRRPRKAWTFRTHSSPAPMQIKLQPAPAILGQESVHTTLSITHHSQERPSTGPQTLQSSREPFAREVVHKLEREEEGDHSQEGSLYSKEATTSGGGHRGPTKTPLEEKEDTVGSVTMINGAMPSTLMG
jgi:hypothetical protein